MDEEKILTSLLLRSGLEDKGEVLTDMIQDSVLEMRAYLNYSENEILPEACVPAVKELTLIRFNRDGTEGIASESQSSGGSTSYMNDLPSTTKRIIRRYRKFKR